METKRDSNENPHGSRLILSAQWLRSPLAERPVPWNGRGRRPVELIEGGDSEGDSQGLPG